MKFNYWVISLVIYLSSTVFASQPRRLLISEGFLECGPLCEELDYSKCHTEAKEGYLSCKESNEICKCYYVGAVLSECINFCSAYNKNTLDLFNSMCSLNVYDPSSEVFIDSLLDLTADNKPTSRDTLKPKLWPSKDNFEKDSSVPQNNIKDQKKKEADETKVLTTGNNPRLYVNQSKWTSVKDAAEAGVFKQGKSFQTISSSAKGFILTYNQLLLLVGLTVFYLF
ncbi:hypothetical protein CANARDRAFT_80621 [[Candida] arabinofermentans NRRL YB-2248]|uniref:Extracellular membrane protein CFEM domain-containing protein n=1 Tax=[Candida] arabinofermentans NRRL YB-2248 TaxID=983967 RepID=A0A1E4SV59_9ASCO|nr:hypothetical protein CANARDRAFT_80621 [[Candida] arabinofermentans NRRL YB-2248]